MNETPTIDDSLPTPPPPPRRDGFATEGETFQHYQVLRRPDGSLWELGRGAMGVTYKAFDTNLRCHVALKVISSDYIHSEMAGQRFVREARVAARLRHPNIASVYHLGVDPQGFFYSMEFIDGETLETMVERVGPLPLPTVLHVGLQVARALAAAAKQGLIHRDIKPANLMVLHENEEGEDRLAVKVIDFGLARSYSTEDSAPQLTATGFVGTPLFSSPEQLEEQDLDIRSDIYSLGVTLWILLTGRPPFEGKMTQVITQHLHAPPPWWQLPACPEPVRLLLEKMLQKNRLQRYQTASELRQAIENCLRAVTGREELLSPEGSDPGFPLRSSVSASESARRTTAGTVAPAMRPTVSPTGTVTEHLGAAARSLVRSAAGSRRLRRLGSPLAVASLVVLFVFGLMYWHTPEGTDDATRASAPARRHPTVLVSPPLAASESTPVPASTPAAVPNSPTPALVAAAAPPVTTPSPAVAPTPEPTPLVPEPTPAATPPPLASNTPAPSGLDGLDGSLTATTATPAIAAVETPDPASVADNAKEDADDGSASPTPKAKGTTSSKSRSHHSAKPTPTPTQNFFQKLFGIKPKPTPKKSK